MITDDEWRARGLYLGDNVEVLRDQAKTLLKSNGLLLAERERTEQAFLRTAEKLQQCEDLAESKRQDRWHATYNAALTAVIASGIQTQAHDAARVRAMQHATCVEVADEAHGSLVKP